VSFLPYYSLLIDPAIWDRTASRGHVRIEWTNRRHADPWRLKVEEFALTDRTLAELSIERKRSPIPGAGHGVYDNFHSFICAIECNISYYM